MNNRHDTWRSGEFGRSGRTYRDPYDEPGRRYRSEPIRRGQSSFGRYENYDEGGYASRGEFEDEHARHQADDGMPSRHDEGAWYGREYEGYGGPYRYGYENRANQYRTSGWRGRDGFEVESNGGEHYRGDANQRAYESLRGYEASRGYGSEQSQFGRAMESHRGKGPKGYARSGERLKEVICERLTDDPTVDASDITVDVSGQTVTLSGTVDSRPARHRAEDLAEYCGARDVVNNLRVTPRDADGKWTDVSQTLSTPTRSTSGMRTG